MPLSNLALHSLSGLTTLASGIGRHKKLFILIYHRVLAEADPMRGYEIDAATFEWQMQLLARFFKVLPLSEALQRMSSGNLPANAVCITFDDGYADNLTQALPILQRYQLPATVFIASAYLNGGRMWNDTVIEALRSIPDDAVDLSFMNLGKLPLGDMSQRASAAQSVLQTIKHLPADLRQQHSQQLANLAGPLPDDLMMTTEQLRQLQRSGIEIGGHTLSHPILAKLSDAEAQREIVDNKRDLETLLSGPIRFFAYPNGKPGQDYLPQHIELLQQAGYQAALSTQWGVADQRSDYWQLPRFTPWDKQPHRFMQRMLQFYLRHRI